MPPSPHRRQRIVLMVAISLCGVCSALALGFGGDGNATAVERSAAHKTHPILSAPRVPSRTADTELVAESGHRRIAASLIRNFQILRPAGSAHAAQAVAIPLPIAASIASSPAGLNVQAARFVAATSGKSFWVIPGSATTCLLENGAPYFDGCGKLTGEGSPDSGGFSEVEGLPGSPQTTVNGLVPDGNKTVTMILADGTSVSVPVVDNVYSATVTATPVVVVSRNAAGSESDHTLPRP